MQIEHTVFRNGMQRNTIATYISSNEIYPMRSPSYLLIDINSNFFQFNKQDILQMKR